MGTFPHFSSLFVQTNTFYTRTSRTLHKSADMQWDRVGASNSAATFNSMHSSLYTIPEGHRLAVVQ